MARVELSARPEPLQISNDTTAIIVNDMQNAFCSAGGYLDRVGFDLSQRAQQSKPCAAFLPPHERPG